MEKLESCRHFDSVFRNAKCEYCGEPAVESSICSEIQGAVQEETHFWCARCRQDLAEFNALPGNAMPDFDVEDDARLEQEFRRLDDRQRRQEHFMSVRVKGRRH